MEVMVSTMLICMCVGSIVAMNVSAAKVLRASRDAAATSQILQQRMETIRERPWNQVATSTGIAALLQAPAQSEAELGDSQLTETMKVTVPASTADGLGETSRFFSLRRAGGLVQVEQAGDFSGERTLLYEGQVTWHDTAGVHQRALRTIICQVGLTRAGILGTVLGRPGSQVETASTTLATGK